MSFSVAVQSAVFYYLACTPCAKVRHRHKARQQAKKEREEKSQIETRQPGLYQHPSPFNTNPYWDEEIMMGPSLPKKGRGGDVASKNTSQRGLTSAGQDSGITTRSSLATSHGGPTADTITADTTADTTPDAIPNAIPSSAIIDGLGSAPTVVPEEDADAASTALSKTASVSTGDDWNRKRYQREDEELWGHELSRTGHKLMDAIKQAGTSAGRFVEAKLGKEKPVTDTDRYNFYYPPKNPPVNDYHPPVVSSKPSHIDGHRWMLQPPPPAKVMEGKVPVSRSASTASMVSKRTMASGDGALARLVGERAVEAKMRMGETPAETRDRSNSSASRPYTRRSAATPRPKSQRTMRSRSLSLSAESDDDPEKAEEKHKSRTRRPVAAPAFESDDEGERISKGRKSSGNSMPATHAAQRPRLSTILNSDTTEQSEVALRNDEGHAEPAVQEVTNASPGEPSGLTQEQLSADRGLALRA